MSNGIVLTNFRPHVMRPHLPQEVVMDYVAWLFNLYQNKLEPIVSVEEAEAFETRVRAIVSRYSASKEQIGMRQLVNTPATLEEEFARGGDYSMPPITSEDGAPSLDMVMKFTEETVLAAFKAFYENETTPPDDLIHATTTGYMLPSPAQKLIGHKQWHDRTTVTHSYHMGCYGAFPPLRMALGFLASNSLFSTDKERVDIVHTETSSVHYNTIKLDPENSVVASLFADGFIKYSVVFGEKLGADRSGLKVLTLKDEIIPDTYHAMSLKPGAHRFDIGLSRDVPMLIKNHIEPYMRSVMQRAGLDFDAEKETMVFALHPGGPKIVNNIQALMGLRDDQVVHSREVLFNHGNMVSATIPHIWKAIVEDDAVAKGTKVFSVAFGPGLTIAGGLFEKV